MRPDILIMQSCLIFVMYNEKLLEKQERRNSQLCICDLMLLFETRVLKKTYRMMTYTVSFTNITMILANIIMII